MNKYLKSMFFTTALTISIALMTSGVFADTILKYGNRSSSVSQLQTVLKQKGYFNYQVTGYFGTVTLTSVKRFQKTSGLKADGIAGPQTLGKLYLKSIVAPLSTVSRGTSSLTQQTKEDLYWLSRIISSEAGGESYEGKLAVGNVILNRVESKAFPDSIKEVIFEYYKGIPQFSPVADGTIYNEPNSESIKAAKEVLNGKNVIANSTYFFNPDKSEGKWIVKNKIFYKTIGEHDFYR